MKKLIYILIISLFASAYLQAQSYVIIVNSQNTTASLSKKEISNFFLKKKKKWASGEKVVPIDLSGKSETRKSFTKEIHKKSIGAIKSYWQQYVFAGKGTPPTEKKTDQEIIDYVSNNIKAVGYVSASADISKVKALKVTD